MTPTAFRQAEPPTPRLWGHLAVVLFIIAAFWGCNRALGQSAGDPKWFFKGMGVGDQTGYVTKVNSTLYSINGSGNFALLAQSNFANASHTHTASAITDFNATGDARWSLLAHTHTFASLTSKPTTIAGYGITDFESLGDARWSLMGHGHDIADVDGLQAALDAKASITSLASLITEDPGAGVGLIESGGGVTPYILKNMKSGNGTTATANTGSVQIDIDANAASIVLDGATDPFLRTSAATGGGTVTSVAVSGSDGIDIDSGSPVTTSGTIALGVNASTLKTHLSLNNVENTALSTWAGSTNINTLGALPSVKINAAVRNLIIAAGSTYASDRTLTLFTDDTNRSLTLGGNTTLNGGTHSGTNTGDQSESSIEALIDLQDCQGAVTDAQVPDNITIDLAATVTTNADLTGPVTSVGNATTIADAELGAIAGLTSADNKIPQFTGSGTAQLADLKLGTEAISSSVSVTWTCGVAPATPTIREYYTQVGNLVTWAITITYTTAGTTCTNLVISFPANFPTPDVPASFAGASVRIWKCEPAYFLPTPTSTTATNAPGYFISRNAANTGFEIASIGTWASSTVRHVTLSGSYFTN